MIDKEEYIEMFAEKTLQLVKDIVLLAEKSHLTNEQWYLDFEDELNKLTTKEHV